MRDGSWNIPAPAGSHQMGVGDEAIHPLHNLLQRSDLTLGVVGRGYGNRCGWSRRRLDHQIRSRRLCGRLRRDGPVAPALLPLSGAARRLLSFGDPVDRRNSIELTTMLVNTSVQLHHRFSASGDRMPSLVIRHVRIALAQ